MQIDLGERVESTPRKKCVQRTLWTLGIALAFLFYTAGLSQNPPGFYLDETGLAYNAYLVSRTGAGEFGPRFPVYFQLYPGAFAQYLSPTQVYLLALVFRFEPPSILAARIFSAFWVFAACLLLGLLARGVSGKGKIGIIVAVTTLLTPWFFDVRGVLLEPHFVPFAIVLFLLALYYAQTKEKWDWCVVITLAETLTLLSYCYTSGRVLAPLFALGLLFFATTRRRLIDIIKTWLIYGVTLVPIVMFNRSHPGVLTKRLYEISYIGPGVPWREIASEFVRRYLEDQNLTALLMTGDYHPRHHVQGSGGAILLATFTLAMIGLGLIIVLRWREPWWRFVLYGLAVSILPGAITKEPFHQMRLMGYPVFLLVLTIPALQWLLAPDGPRQSTYGASEQAHGSESDRAAVVSHGLRRPIRLGFLGILLAATVVQAIDFQVAYRREGPKRLYDFDAPYKPLYDAAVAQPQRPVYLENAQWGPAYMNAYWYATVEHRPLSEFVRLPDGAKPPPGAIVLSSNSDCQNCEVIKKSGLYELYKAK